MRHLLLSVCLLGCGVETENPAIDPGDVDGAFAAADATGDPMPDGSMGPDDAGDGGGIVIVDAEPEPDLDAWVDPDVDGGTDGDDAGAADAGPLDAGSPDAGSSDAGPADAGPADAGPPDAGPPDAGPSDAGPPDTGPIIRLDAGPATCSRSRGCGPTQICCLSLGICCPDGSRTCCGGSF